MSGVPPWSKSVGELAPIAPTEGLPSVASCIAHPPGFPGLELAVPHDATAGIETMVEHALGVTVAGIEHGTCKPAIAPRCPTYFPRPTDARVQGEVTARRLN
jgi:hypothetical protein